MKVTMSDIEWEIVEAWVPLAFVLFFLSFFCGNHVLRTVRVSTRVNSLIVLFLCLLAFGAVKWVHFHPSESQQLGRGCSTHTVAAAAQKVPQNARVKIITSADGKSTALGDLTTPILREYANRHGYDFYRHSQCSPPRRALQWTKIPLLHFELELAQKYGLPEWVIWIDADAIFAELDYDIYERFLKTLPAKLDLLVAPDVKEWGREINTGFMAVRNSPGARAILDAIWRYGPSLHLRYNWFHEQGTLQYLKDTDSSIRERVLVLTSDVPGVRMYSDGSLLSGEFSNASYAWRPGHLVAHAIGPKTGGTDKKKAVIELIEYARMNAKDTASKR